MQSSSRRHFLMRAKDSVAWCNVSVSSHKIFVCMIVIDEFVVAILVLFK